MTKSFHRSHNQWVICEVHFAFMQENNQNNCSFEQVTILGFCQIKMFHEASPFAKTPNSPFHLYSIPYMHFTICMICPCVQKNHNNFCTTLINEG